MPAHTLDPPNRGLPDDEPSLGRRRDEHRAQADVEMPLVPPETGRPPSVQRAQAHLQVLRPRLRLGGDQEAVINSITCVAGLKKSPPDKSSGGNIPRGKPFNAKTHPPGGVIESFMRKRSAWTRSRSRSICSGVAPRSRRIATVRARATSPSPEKTASAPARRRAGSSRT